MPVQDSATLKVSIDARGAVHGANELKGAVGGVTGASGSLGDSIIGMATKIGAAYVSFRALAGAFNFVKKEMMESEQANFKLAASYNNFGQAIPGGIDGLNDMADSLSKISVYEDEVIKSTMAMMMSFKNINPAMMPRFLQAAMDMASARGGSLEDAGFKLAMALDSPAEGMARLGREGIRLTDIQEKEIKSLMATNDILKAQGMILDLVESKFRGNYAAQFETLGGQMSALGNKMGDLVKPGEGVVEVLTETARAANNVLDAAEELKKSNWLDWLTGGIGSRLQDRIAARAPADANTITFREMTLEEFNKPREWQSGYTPTDDQLAQLDKELDALDDRNDTLNYYIDVNRRNYEMNKLVDDTLASMSQKAGGLWDKAMNWLADYNKTIKETEERANIAKESLHEMGEMASETFADAIVNATSFSNALADVGRQIEKMIIQQSLQAGFNYFFPGVKKAAAGDVFTSPDLTTIAERGPEVVLPLKRGPDGNLGVGARSGGGGSSGSGGPVNVQIVSPDARGIRDILLKDPRFMMELNHAFRQGYASI